VQATIVSPSPWRENSVSSAKSPLDTRLIQCPERPVGVWLPVPLSARLDALTEIGKYAWAPATRKELMSALLLDAPRDGKKLKRILGRYANAIVADAFLEGVEEWRFLYMPNSRGPRKELPLFEDRRRPTEKPVAVRDEVLSTARTYRIGILVEAPLAGRLELLVEAAEAAGITTTRKDLIAALVLDAPVEGAKLAKRLARYWHATVSDAVIPGMPADPVLALPDTAARIGSREKADREAEREARRKSKRKSVPPTGSLPRGATRARPKRVPPPAK
jgi:hypothetical protein